jgi:hypothetical protein
VAGLQEELAGKSVLKAEQILRETARIAMSTPAGLVKRVKGQGGPETDKVTFLMPDELPADVAAAAIVRSLTSGPEVVYVSGIWWPIMRLIQHLPSFLMRRLNV